MKSILFIILIFSNNLYSQNNFGFNGSKIFFLNKNFGAVVKKNHTVAITSDGAKSWKNIIVETDEELRKVLFTSESNGWLIGEKGIYNTIDTGNTWQKNYSIQVLQLKALFFINDENGFIGGEGIDTLSTIYITHNSGKSWINSTIDSNWYYQIGINDFSFINDSFGIVIGTNTIYKTQDGGNYWQKLPINFFYADIGSISYGKMLDKDNIIITAWYPAVYAVGYLLSSTDGGTNWSKYGNSYQTFDFGIQDAYILNKDSIWLTTESNKVYTTTNGGNTWDTLGIQLNMFSFFSNYQAYGLGEKYLYYSDDGWRTYNLIDSIITGINASNETNITPHSIILNQNYPNPFNPITTISFEIPEKEIVELSIYNILGQKIETLLYKELNKGKHEIIFNAEELTSGIYFYQILTYNYQETRKCIFLK